MDREKLRRFRALYTALRLASDLAMVNLALVAAYWLRFQTAWFAYLEIHFLKDYLPFFLLESLLLPPLLALQGLYRFRRQPSRLDDLVRVFTATLAALVLTTAAIAFTSREFNYSRLLIVMNVGLAVAFIWLGRMLLQGALWGLWRGGHLRDRALIVGSGEMAQAIMERLRRSPQLGYEVVGVVTDRYPVGSWIDGLPVLGGTAALGNVVQEYGATEVLIAEAGLSQDQLPELVAQCPVGRVGVRVAPSLFQLTTSAVSIDDLGAMPMVVVRDVALRGWNLVIKRLMDLLMSSAVLLLLGPLMLLIAVVTKLTSPKGPVFYLQERVGLDDRPFLMIKFRSMKADAERETGPVWAEAEDPRRTPFGAFLRRWSLDELPQFINILLGEMSMVGPRPERPHFVEQFQRVVPRYLERHREKSGLTGWAQVNGLRGNSSVEQRTAYDLWYVENWTPWLDIKIMLRTLAAVARGENAY